VSEKVGTSKGENESFQTNMVNLGRIESEADGSKRLEESPSGSCIQSKYNKEKNALSRKISMVGISMGASYEQEGSVSKEVLEKSGSDNNVPNPPIPQDKETPQVPKSSKKPSILISSTNEKKDETKVFAKAFPKKRTLHASRIITIMRKFVSNLLLSITRHFIPSFVTQFVDDKSLPSFGSDVHLPFFHLAVKGEDMNSSTPEKHSIFRCSLLA